MFVELNFLLSSNETRNETRMKQGTTFQQMEKKWEILIFIFKDLSILLNNVDYQIHIAAEISLRSFFNLWQFR